MEIDSLSHVFSYHLFFAGFFCYRDLVGFSPVVDAASKICIPLIALGLSACARGDELTKGYCQKSTDGHTICIKRENIFCENRSGYLSCNAAGVMTDLRGESYHWSTSKHEYHQAWWVVQGVPCSYVHTFTANAAKHFGMCK